MVPIDSRSRSAKRRDASLLARRADPGSCAGVSPATERRASLQPEPRRGSGTSLSGRTAGGERAETGRGLRLPTRAKPGSQQDPRSQARDDWSGRCPQMARQTSGGAAAGGGGDGTDKKVPDYWSGERGGYSVKVEVGAAEGGKTRLDPRPPPTSFPIATALPGLHWGGAVGGPREPQAPSRCRCAGQLWGASWGGKATEKSPSWRRKWPPTSVFWPGEFQELYSPWGRKESDTLSDFHYHCSMR